MVLVYSSPDWILVHHLSNVLTAEGIRNKVKNDRLLSAGGEIPNTEFWPELWIHDESLRRHAEALIEQHLAEPAEANQWQCQQCNEWHGEAFTECWNCGAPRPDSA